MLKLLVRKWPLQSKNLLSSLSRAGFSGGHHSGSDSDHDHHHHHTTTSGSESDGLIHQKRKTVIPEKYSIDKILESINTPIIPNQTPKIQENQYTLNVFKTENEYIDFLALNFEKHALIKYPDYKAHLSEFQHKIPNFDKLNAYQKEVHILHQYGQWKLEKLRDDTYLHFEGSNDLQKAENRVKFYQKITGGAASHDHHDESRILHHLKEQLKEVVGSEHEFEKFKNKYNEDVERQLLEKIVEKKKKNFFYEFTENKTETNIKLADLKAPMNPYKPIYSVSPHEHIHPQHYLKEPMHDAQDIYKYLGYFDIILDNHLRQVRPNQIYDDKLAYVKPQNRPTKYSETLVMDNMYFDYLYSMDNDLFRKLKKEFQIFNGEPVTEEKDHSHHGNHVSDHGHHEDHGHNDGHHSVTHHADEDPNRPCGALWKDEHKFPHVADRLGWHHLAETPWDKNILFENVLSHPIYQWQPFVQTPPLDPHEDLNFEQGETVYENKWVKEWVYFWRVLYLLIFAPFILTVYESYLNQATPSPDYLMSMGVLVGNHNMGHRSTDRPIMNKIKFWGKDLWYWQHLVRKGPYYLLALSFAPVYLRGAGHIGKEYVSKMVFNKERDLVFIWRSKFVFSQRVETFELHYLEQYVPNIVMSWKHLGVFKEDGIFCVRDDRTGADLLFYNEKKYWNVDQRDYFFKNTTTYWRGLRDKHIDSGITINNSYSVDPADVDNHKKVRNELKAAVEKYGPLTFGDFEHNPQYYFYKRTLEEKQKILNPL